MENKIKNIFTVDLEDWFFTDNYTIDLSKIKVYEQNLINNTKTILKLLESSKNTATFFVLGKIAETMPELLSMILSSGHEIASHGYEHKMISKMSEVSFSEDIEKAKTVFMRVKNIEPIGFRAPNLFNILKIHGLI